MARCDSYFYKPEVLDKVIKMDKDTQTNEEEFFKIECSEHKMQFKFQNEAHLKIYEQHMKNRCRVCMKQSNNLQDSLSEHSKMELKACLAFLMSSLDFSENMCEGCTQVLKTVKIWIFHWSNSEKLFIHLKDAAKEFRKNHTIRNESLDELKVVSNESIYQAFQRLEIKPNEADRIEASAHTKYRRRSSYVPKKITNLSTVEQFMVTKFTNHRMLRTHNEANSSTFQIVKENAIKKPDGNVKGSRPRKPKTPLPISNPETNKILVLANPNQTSHETITIPTLMNSSKNHWCKPIKKATQSPDARDEAHRLIVSSPRTPTVQMNSIPVYQVNLNCIQNQQIDSSSGKPTPLIIIKSPKDLNSQADILKIYDPSKSLEALSRKVSNASQKTEPTKRKADSLEISNRRKSLAISFLKSETPPTRRVTRSMSTYKPTPEIANSQQADEVEDCSGSEVEWNPDDDLDGIWVKEYSHSMRRRADKEEQQFLGFDTPIWKNNSRRKSVLLS